VFGVPLRIFFGIVTAMLLTRPKRGVNGYRTLFFMPSMAPTVGASLVFVYLFNPATGPINQFLGHIGLNQPLWFFDPRWAKPALLILGLWGIGDAIVLYLAGITWFGWHFRGSQHSLKDYFLGGRRAPWWALALSIVSAETSTLTVIGTPALSFNGNFAFLQLVLGYLLARIVIATLFLPAYFRGEMYTAYELMRVRFGDREFAVMPLGDVLASDATIARVFRRVCELGLGGRLTGSPGDD
jgi:hypothetical protein